MGLSGLERFEIELHCKIHFFLNPRTLFRDRKRVWNPSWTPWRQTENEYKSNFDLLKRYSCILHYSMDVNLKKKNHLFWKYFSFIIFLVIVTGQWTILCLKFLLPSLFAWSFDNHKYPCKMSISVLKRRLYHFRLLYTT